MRRKPRLREEGAERGFASMKTIAKVGYVVLIVASLVVTVPLWYRVMFAEPIVAVEGEAVEGEKQPPPAVMVDYGDTLWAIAKRYYPNAHTGKVVEAIRELNPGIDPGKLKVGQWIDLPRIEVD